MQYEYIVFNDNLKGLKMGGSSLFNTFTVCFSVAEPHHFYAAPAPDPAPGENFDAVPDPAAPAPTLLYSKAKLTIV
jgi:hypothetical protein